MKKCVIVLALTLGACAATYPTPPPPRPRDGIALQRFDLVAEGVYRSSQPSAEEFRELVQRYGLRAVVKLNTGPEPAPPGVVVIRQPLDAGVEPPAQAVQDVLDAIDRAPKPVLVHCTHGEDRTGLIVALYRIRHGASVEQAYTDMMRRGFHPYRGVWHAWLRAVGWDRQ